MRAALCAFALLTASISGSAALAQTGGYAVQPNAVLQVQRGNILDGVWRVGALGDLTLTTRPDGLLEGQLDGRPCHGQYLGNAFSLFCVAEGRGPYLISGQASEQPPVATTARRARIVAQPARMSGRDSSNLSDRARAHGGDHAAVGDAAIKVGAATALPFKAKFILEALMKPVLAILAAAAVLAAPASAQSPNQARPGVNVAPQTTITAPGQLSLAGVWHMTSPNCSRLTLTRDQNRHVSGNMRMGACGAPGFNGVELPCSGYQHHNNQFTFVCEHAGGIFVLVGRVEPVTRRGESGPQALAPARIVGREHHSYFTSDPNGARLVDYPLAGERVS